MGYYELKEEDWKKVMKQYKRLMYMIAHKIGGDRVAHDFDDNFQELSTACMEAITTYAKKLDISFDEFFGTAIGLKRNMVLETQCLLAEVPNLCTV